MAEDKQNFARFVRAHAPLMVLTGAGISTDSGIPAYRDRAGQWVHRQPVQHRTFLTDPSARQRYWARSLAGWPTIRDARPNAAHQRLVELEQTGMITGIVTQNVDRLHQKAGSLRAIDLHGRADEVLCLQCSHRCQRDDFHHWCAELNPTFTGFRATTAPDGDADLELDFSSFEVPDCPRCAGVMKPDVVFFGDNVPTLRKEAVNRMLDTSNGLLVIGSSLMVYSGYRLCLRAHEQGKPITLLTRGVTRADGLASLKLETSIGGALEALREQLSTHKTEKPATHTRHGLS
ncbi:MAG: NAD-dependent protein deacetylase [Pseudomonadota bacterium]